MDLIQSRRRAGRAAGLLAVLAGGLVLALLPGPVQASPDQGSLPPQARPAADPDADAVKDPHDNCPDAANADQADLDGDGTGNQCDPDWQGIGDATVLAIVDYHPLSPYVWDLDADHMPQATDGDPTNDLPLDRHPAEWLPGYADMPGTTVHEVDLTLSKEIPSEWPVNPTTGERDESLVTREQLTRKDQARVWDAPGVIRESDAKEVNLYWFKDTKILGAAEFGSLAHDVGPHERSGLNRTAPDTSQELGDGHGVGTSSVSVGNLHGMCPECLLVFLEVDVNGVDPGDTQPTDYAGVEEALEWAYAQPWIDAVVMQGAPSAMSGTRERAYSGSDIAKQVAAAEAGQTFLVSSGNGLDGLRGLVPSSTLLSSLQGPDWAVTVGGTDTALERDNNPTGFGKPVDVSGTSAIYRSAYMSRTVGGTAAAFRATSNAVAVVSGTYVKALHEVRRGLPGPSRRLAGGVVAAGPAGCGAVRPDCELADGLVTAAELRARLLLGAVPTAPGSAPASRVAHPGGETTLVVPALPEEDFAVEGHGTYSGRCEDPLPTTTERNPAPPLPVSTPVQGTTCMLRPVDTESGELSNVLGPLWGTKEPLARRKGEAEWFRIDSYCRQQVWGSWEHGLFHATERPRPAADVAAYPVRSAYEAVCPRFAEAYPDRVPDVLKPYPPRP